MNRLEMNMANEEQQTNVEKYEFEPIKGYPMLNWKGKRPFRSTQYFPAQLKEVYGKEDESGWINKIFWGDNLQVMSHLLKEFRGKIDLVYIDPPFDSKTDYSKKIQLKSKTVESDISSFEEKQYTDLWTNDDYLQFIYERVILIKELLSSTGSIWIHCDWHKSHHIRLICDEVFGSDLFINEIIWKRKGGSAGTTNSFGIVTDTILGYGKTSKYKFKPQYTRDSEEAKEYIRKRFNKEFDGRRYMPAPIERNAALGLRENLKYEYKGYIPTYGWMMSQAKLEEMDENNRLEWNSKGKPVRRMFLDEYKGQPVENLWTDIFVINPMANERVNYPTQKPVQLVSRIIESCTDENDIVFDCFLGSGTSAVASQVKNRKYIGADINLGSIQTTVKRLNNEDAQFCVYNVNNYDLFKNPAQAKDLLIETLEIQKLDSSVVYDGEKDGYKVKIMPVNRIATKEDLNELVANFPYKKFEERKAANPNKPVEEIMLVCMGHEPALGATLENECGYKLKVEVVDILRDKSDLTFKYDSEAVINVQDGKLIVEAFYPRNLLQKLSQQKDDVAEWREMVESIMIDWNYDGAVMEPVVIDIPDKNEFVAGQYEIPEGASNIKIKITDLLSESYEEVIAHG
ncbi:D12 class N6 adenine-specific DNA methyltransferase family protein [Vibrio cholerae HE-40]|nr:D12 class N6 adenine-specific DNA methyltransferase family protein [Vibrio cholerae HE-40]EKL36635.1 D12 class N6 adenine-specific DNA methyltransferase family protein [Vibrio cholerae HE-46]EMA2454565.1 site-specific DNA-methyltransferase [Vibrio cholerae]